MAILVGKIYRTLRATVLATDLDSFTWIQFHNCSSVFSNQMFLVTLRRNLDQWNRYCVSKGCTRVQMPQSRSWVVWNNRCTRLCYKRFIRRLIVFLIGGILYKIYKSQISNLPNVKYIYKTKYQIYQMSNIFTKQNLKSTKCQTQIYEMPKVYKKQISNLPSTK